MIPCNMVDTILATNQPPNPKQNSTASMSGARAVKMRSFTWITPSSLEYTP